MMWGNKASCGTELLMGLVCILPGVLGCMTEEMVTTRDLALEETPAWKAFEDAWVRYESQRSDRKGLEKRKANVELLQRCLQPLCDLQRLERVARTGPICRAEIRAIADVVVSRLFQELGPAWQVSGATQAMWEKEQYQKLRQKMPLLQDLVTKRWGWIHGWTKKYFVDDLRRTLDTVEQITPESLRRWPPGLNPDFQDV
ncbi:MAG TPA: hypothetical protein VMY69_02345, partial [Phycisphaerae bacterium]|nr:hypothetical protein [Phycisphaerae bacterium]